MFNDLIFPTRQQSCWKVMFSVVCPLVKHSVYSRGPMWPLPMIHWTSPHRDPLTPVLSPWTLDLTVQGPPSLLPPGHGTSLYRDPTAPPPNMEPHCTGTPSPTHAVDIWWPRLETCSDLFTMGSPTVVDIWWLLKHIQSTQVGGTHLTGILPCFNCKLQVNFWIIIIRWIIGICKTRKHYLPATSLAVGKHTTCTKHAVIPNVLCGIFNLFIF